MEQKSSIKNLTDEDLRVELQRRVEETSAFTDDLGDLPLGTWNQRGADVLPTDNRKLRAEWMEIVKLSLARVREMLAIPIDPADPNYGATMRGINSAVSSGLTFVSRINAEMLRPPKEDIMPKIIKQMEIERQNLFETKTQKLLKQLIPLTEEQINRLLQKRLEKLAAPKDVLEQLADLDSSEVDRLLKVRREKLPAKKDNPPNAIA
jgi:hypothetical protein